MIVEKINYQRTFNLGNYSSERIGVDININAGEEPNIALDTAKKLVEEWHLKNNPQLYQDKTPDIPVIPQSTLSMAQKMQAEDLTPTERTIKAINSFTQISGANGLESFKLLVKGKPELEEAYSKRLNELT